MDIELRVYKIILVGPANSGKTTFVHRQHTGEFIKNYVPTLGVEVIPLTFNTTEGLVTLNIWDCAGNAKYGGLQEAYFINADGAIVMYDSTNEKSLSEVHEPINRVKTIYPDIPIVVCANKYDLKGKKYWVVRPEHQFLTSGKSYFNLEKPFLYLIRNLLNNPNVEFTATEVLSSPEVKMDTELLSQYQEEIEMLNKNQPLSLL